MMIAPAAVKVLLAFGHMNERFGMDPRTTRKMCALLRRQDIGGPRRRLGGPARDQRDHRSRPACSSEAAPHSQADTRAAAR